MMKLMKAGPCREVRVRPLTFLAGASTLLVSCDQRIDSRRCMTRTAGELTNGAGPGKLLSSLTYPAIDEEHDRWRE